ncbi:MAG: hypothetical protein IT428_31515 [Planctomycetaceae bacterium]|nr:hypothetical protein [Planctomycetaceae bacterium]
MRRIETRRGYGVMVAINSVLSKDASAELVKALAETDEEGQALVNKLKATADAQGGIDH